MKISVITVSFNSASTIERCIQSVKSQTYKNVEYIIIDGQSQDGTVEIVNRCKNFVDIFISEQDAGIYDAMNKGIALATGDIIAFLNSDDIYAGTWVLSEVASSFSDSELDAIFGDLSYFNIAHPNKVTRVYRSPDNPSSALSWGIIPAHPTLFLRREIFASFGVFDSSFKIAGDFDLMAKIFRSNSLRYKNLHKVMVKMQLGGISTAGMRSTILLNQEIYRSCCNNLIHTNYLKLCARYLKKILEFKI
ncbi:MAG: glycosyltransferase [Polynucleobacter sp.]|nr:glycosyltransferase [Polynucleobacter sp.]